MWILLSIASHFTKRYPKNSRSFLIEKAFHYPYMECLLFFRNGRLNYSYINCGRSFFAFFNVKGNAVVFIERFETGCIDAGMMNKYIRSIFLLDKSVPFTAVKPFYNSISHRDILLSNSSHSSILKDATLTKWIFPLERNRPAN